MVSRRLAVVEIRRVSSRDDVSVVTDALGQSLSVDNILTLLRCILAGLCLVHCDIVHSSTDLRFRLYIAFIPIKGSVPTWCRNGPRNNSVPL